MAARSCATAAGAAGLRDPGTHRLIRYACRVPASFTARPFLPFQFVLSWVPQGPHTPTPLFSVPCRVPYLCPAGTTVDLRPGLQIACHVPQLLCPPLLSLTLHPFTFCLNPRPLALPHLLFSPVPSLNGCFEKQLNTKTNLPSSFQFCDAPRAGGFKRGPGGPVSGHRTSWRLALYLS